MSDDAARILERAADLVEEGWARRCFACDTWGASVEPTSGLAVAWCPLGAIDRASLELGFPDEECANAAETILTAEILRLGHHSLPTWNDEPGRTADEVTDLMREAAASLREPAGAVA